jgi:hypothetical protein
LTTHRILYSRFFLYYVRKTTTHRILCTSVFVGRVGICSF